MYKEVLPTPDGDGNVYIQYFDEALNRRSLTIKADGTRTYYVEYWGDTSTVKTESVVDATGGWVKDIHYYESGMTEWEVLADPDAEGNIYYH